MAGWIKNLGKDSLVYGVGYGVTRFLNIIILPIIAKALTLSEFGYYSSYIILHSLLGGFLIFGLDSAVARYFYESEDKKYHEKLLSSAFFFIVMLCAVCVVTLFLIPNTLLAALDIPAQYATAIPYVILTIPSIALNNFFLSWFKWKRQKIYFLIASGSGIVLLMLPLLLTKHVSFGYIFQVLLFSQVATTAISLLLASSYIRFTFNPAIMRTLLIYGLPWLLVNFLGSSRIYLDRFFLLSYLDADNYGLYNFSVRVSSLLSVLLTAFDLSFGPLAFSIWNKEGAPKFFARLQSLYIFLICSAACAICILAPVVIDLLGGTKYIGAEKVLPLLLFALIPPSLINFSNLGTVYAKKSFLSTVCLFFGFLAVFLFNALFTRSFLQYGAASSSLLGHLIIIMIGYWLSHKYYPIPFKYLRDALLFIGFLALSLIGVRMRLTFNIYTNAGMELLILGLIIALISVFSFPEEYKKLRMRLRSFSAYNPRK